MSITDTILENITHELINTREITVDPNGQRDVERRRAQFNRIMKNFDPYKVNDIKVALIDGKYYCFDGQMTMKVLKAKNKGNDLNVPCKVYHGLTLYDAAQNFIEQETYRSNVTIGDKLRVLAAYGNEDAIGFMRDTEKSGATISWTGGKSSNTITCIATAFKSYLRYKDKSRYVAMLQCMRDAWKGFPEQYNRHLIEGMTELFLTYPELDPERMTSKLMLVRPSDILRDAQVDRSCGVRKYAVTLLQIYNKSARDSKRLPNKL